MSDLDRHVQGYLALRRAVGFKLVGEGQLLAEFVKFAEQAGQSTVTTQTALEWARLPASGSPNYLSRRLRAVRAFARYLHALDPACERRIGLRVMRRGARAWQGWLWRGAC
jgi:hypothetical protein